MKFTIKLKVKIDRKGRVLYHRSTSTPLYLGKVYKKDGAWFWQIPIQHRTEILPGRFHEEWSTTLGLFPGVATRREAVLILVSFHWARGYVGGEIQ